MDEQISRPDEELSHPDEIFLPWPLQASVYSRVYQWKCRVKNVTRLIEASMPEDVKLSKQLKDLLIKM